MRCESEEGGMGGGELLDFHMMVQLPGRSIYSCIDWKLRFYDHIDTCPLFFLWLRLFGGFFCFVGVWFVLFFVFFGVLVFFSFFPWHLFSKCVKKLDYFLHTWISLIDWGMVHVSSEWGEWLGKCELRLRTMLKHHLSLTVLWSCISSYFGGCDVRAVGCCFSSSEKTMYLTAVVLAENLFLSQGEMEVTGVLTTTW